MRGRNSALERAESAAATPPGYDAAATAAVSAAAANARVPQLPHQCADCRRWLSRDRLCVVPVGAADLCGLCSAIAMVQGSIPSSTLSDSEEEAAIAALQVAYTLVRQGFGGGR